MTSRQIPLMLLADMADRQEADAFVLMTQKEPATTRDGRPFFKVGFRDDRRVVQFPVWNDAPWADACRDEWHVGQFYKVRAVYRETSYGPQLELRKIREVTDEDREDGFDETMCLPRSRYSSVTMFDELLEIIQQHIDDDAVRLAVADVMNENRDRVMVLPAAARNHHGFVGGYLEHVLSVTRTCLYLADKYGQDYADLDPPLSKDVVVAGAILHDIGKLIELEVRPEGAAYTPQGELIGHILLGRDIVRDAAQRHGVNEEMQLRLEHVIVSHQRLPEWGSPKPPMTPEALIVHYADDLDAKFHMMYAALAADTGDGPLTGRNNPLHQKVFRGKR